jgi:hypothetical protein
MKIAALGQVRGTVARLVSLMHLKFRTMERKAEAKSILKKLTGHR